MARPFYRHWPENWEALARQLTLHLQWPPDAAWRLTGTELLEWLAEAERRAKEAKQRGK